MDRRERREKELREMLGIIKKNPGIRPREINKFMRREHSASLRNMLIKRGLVRKVRMGTAVHYYAK